jgi:signal transduction histidine kinase
MLWPTELVVLGRLPIDGSLAVALGGWILLAAVLLLLSIYAYLAARLPLHANRVLFWTLMLALIVLGQAAALSPERVPAAIGLALQLAGAAGLTYSVLHYRLFDVRDALRRGLGYALSTLVISCVALAALLLANRFAAVGGSSGAAGVVIVAVSLALVFQPLWRASQHQIARHILGDRADPAGLVRDYSQAIAELRDVDALATAAIGMMSDVLEVRRGALILVTAEAGGRQYRLQPVRGMGQLPLENCAVPSESLVMRRLSETRGPLLQYDIDLGPDFREIAAAERAWWHGLAMDVYVPVMGRDEPIGILALGPKGSGNSFRPAELDLLTTLARQTAVALHNARLFSDMRQLNAEIRLLNEDLSRTNERLQSLDKVKTDFITIASHELRTPLTQVRGYTELLALMNEDGQVPADQLADIVASLGRASERLEQVITAMLDVSQLDVQAMSMHFVPTYVDTILRFVLEHLAPAIRERRQTLHLRGVQDLPPLYGDFQRLCQTFTNLLTNAIKYTPDGGRLTVSGQLLNGPGDYIEIVVADTGVGVDRKDQELIFEKFYRVGNPHLHSTGTTKFMGAGPGLGLPIARGVIEAHGGRIWVESAGFDPQHCPGSAFHVVLPRRPPTVSSDGALAGLDASRDASRDARRDRAAATL